jgi:hypothetical protein
MRRETILHLTARHAGLASEARSFIARRAVRPASLAATFRAFLREKFAGRLAFGGVESLVAVLVELLDKLDVFAHAARRTAKPARPPTPTRPGWIDRRTFGTLAEGRGSGNQERKKKHPTDSIRKGWLHRKFHQSGLNQRGGGYDPKPGRPLAMRLGVTEQLGPVQVFELPPWAAWYGQVTLLAQLERLEPPLGYAVRAGESC